MYCYCTVFSVVYHIIIIISIIIIIIIVVVVIIVIIIIIIIISSPLINFVIIVVIIIIIPQTQRSCWGVYWFHSVRPSVRPSRTRVRSVTPIVLVGSISYVYIVPSILRRRVAFKVSRKISIFLNV